MSEFYKNKDLDNYIITLLGYTKIFNNNGNRHTNWFLWNRFKDVFETIGYKCEWVELKDLIRKDEKRLFITWNEPSGLELYQSGQLTDSDLIFQRLTSLGKGMNDVNWTDNPKKWYIEWNWPIYRTVEYLYELGVNIYGFGCPTDINAFPEKKRICEKLKDRIHYITWGSTALNWNQIKNCQPVINNLTEDITFVGSKWGKIGRGNIDSWKKYIEPFEQDCQYQFKHYGGNGKKMISDTEMINILQKSKLCPIMHNSACQAEQGLQDRFYTVFLSGRFGICDNLGAINIFGNEIKDICTEDPREYYKKSIYYLQHPKEQTKYIKFIQDKIKKEFNFYRQWEKLLNNIRINSQLFSLKYSQINTNDKINKPFVDIERNNINYKDYNSQKFFNYQFKLFKNLDRSNYFKLKYKLNLFNNSLVLLRCDKNTYRISIYNNDIFINNVLYRTMGKNNLTLKIFTINDNFNKVYFNDHFLLNIDNIKDIEIPNKQFYSCSINLPISLINLDYETLINLDYHLSKLISYPYQINILHIDNNIDLLDNIVLENINLNYIYVNNPYNFNLGYCRNLYKFLCLSKNILFLDVDIPLEKEQIDIMISQLLDYDIVKPYNKKLIHLSREEKYQYLKTPLIPNKDPIYLFTITGGNTLFKEKVLQDCGGYEELNCYGGEDRFLDVMILKKGYKVKKNEFNLVHLWHAKLFLKGEKRAESLVLQAKLKEFNLKYYNCTLNLNGLSLKDWIKGKTDIHCECQHKEHNVDNLILHKKKFNFNLNLFLNNQYQDSINLKPELI